METNSVVFFNDQEYPGLTDKPVIAAWQIINPENIGNLIRLADNVGAEDVYILGEDFHHRMSSIKKTAGHSFNNVRLTFIAPEDFFNQLNPGFKILAIETSEDSTNIFTGKLPDKIVFMLGNERNGLPEEILQKCHQKVHIPMTGKCKSMNVSHSSICIYRSLEYELFDDIFEVFLRVVRSALGNERNGLPEEILQKCHQKVHIPMTGKCKSMNVSHALAVAIFEWQRQMLFTKTNLL